MAKKKTRVRRLQTRPISLTCDVQFPADQLNASAASENTTPTFSMVAYTGQPMLVGGWRHPVLVDLHGLDVSAKSRPILKDHDPSTIVGHTTSILKEGGKLLAEGIVSGETEVTAHIIRSAKKGFPWQASIGARPLDVKYIDEGVKITANGRTFEGPLYHVRKARLSEISFVVLGADDDTSSKVAATAQCLEVDMEFEKWLEAMGLNAEELNDAQLDKLQAKYEKEINATAPGGERTIAQDDTRPERPPVRASVLDGAIEEAKYVAEIQAAAGGDAEILAHALAGKWSANETRLAKENKDIKASRPEPVNAAVHTRESVVDDDIITAGLCLSMGMAPEDLVNPFDGLKANDRAGYRGDVKPLSEKAVDIADTQLRGIGLQEAVLLLARRDAKYNGIWGSGESAIRAAFSTLSLPTVFQDALNRSLLSQYKMMDLNWRKVAGVGSVKDFRQTTRFRIHGTGHWEALAPGGELKHGQIEEGDKYYNQASTIGQMLMLTREDFVNDDLGALNNIARMMTFYGTLAPEIEVFKTLLDNAGSFFHANNDNLISGASSAFGYESLKTLYTQFRTRRDRGVSKDAGKKPVLDIQPKILLVPAELEIDAQILMGQTELAVGGSNAATGLITTRNPVANKFRVVSSAYLSDTTVSSGASSTAFYLLAEPTVLPAVEIVFLNGKQRPTIESVEPRPELLGMGFRGWFDFGCALIDPKAACKSAGA